MTDTKHEIVSLFHRAAQLLRMEEGHRLRVSLSIKGDHLICSAASEDDPHHLFHGYFPDTAMGTAPPVASQEVLRRRLRFDVSGYPDLDADSLVFLRRFGAAAGDSVLAIGDNEEPTARILHAAGYRVLGVDLRPHRLGPPPYPRLEGDFCQVAAFLAPDSFGAAYSLSALEHFGLRAYGEATCDPDADAAAAAAAYRLLRPGGCFYVTVPFGKYFVFRYGLWRIYNDAALRQRLIGRFTVVDCRYFLSAAVPGLVAGRGGWLSEAAAASYESDEHPSVTVFLKLRKPS